MTSLLNKIRFTLKDNNELVTQIFDYPTSAILSLEEPNVNSISAVYKNDVESGVTYTYNSTSKKITLTSAFTSNDIIKVEFYAYLNYSDTEIKQHIQAALLYLSIHNYFDFEYDVTDDMIYPELEVREENLIALITATLINKPVASYRLPDISINFAETKTVDEKIEKLIFSFKKDTHGNFDIISY